MEFIYIKKGTGLVSVDFIPYEVHGSDIIVVCPGKLHTIEKWNQESMEYENIIFDLNLLRSRQPDVCWETYLSPISRGQKNLPVLITKSLPSYSRIASCLDQIDQIRETFPEGYELLIKGKLFELFFFFSGTMSQPPPLLLPVPQRSWNGPGRSLNMWNSITAVRFP